MLSFIANMHISRDVLYSLRIALKAKFVGMAVGIFLAVTLATLLSAYFGGRQPVTVALDVGFSTIRLLLPLLIVLLAQENQLHSKRLFPARIYRLFQSMSKYILWNCLFRILEFSFALFFSNSCNLLYISSSRTQL